MQPPFGVPSCYFLYKFMLLIKPLKIHDERQKQIAIMVSCFHTVLQTGVSWEYVVN